MAPRIPLTPDLRAEYARLFQTARLRPDRTAAVHALAGRMTRPENWSRYAHVAVATAVPPHVIALLHALEAGLDFRSHLHNGDPLTARTVRVPKGRPLDGQPPFTWEESARDALTLKKLPQWTDWSLAGIAYVLEGYNGFGYRLYHPEVKSPYLWSATIAYTAGKYVADGSWSATAVSKQCGAMALLACLVELGRVDLAEAAASAPETHATTALTRAAARPAWSGPVLGPGATGLAVSLVQNRLSSLGFPETGRADGRFGPKTTQAVKGFQRQHAKDKAFPLAVDGLVGQRTWQALFASVATA